MLISRPLFHWYWLYHVYFVVFFDLVKVVLKEMFHLFSNWHDTLWSTIFSTLINAKDDSLIVPLIDRMANILEQPHAVQRLQDAILYKNDLLIDDD